MPSRIAGLNLTENNAWNSGIRVAIQNTIDLQKIRNLMNEANVEILVGFPSGLEHVNTLHKDDFDNPNERRRGKYVGIAGEDPESQQPIETAELAKMLHYGTQNIPPRPFLEEGIRQNIGKIKRALQDESQKLAEGKKANWGHVGTLAVGAIREFISSDYYKQRVPNAKSTIRWKGSDIPLIDGGVMKESLQFIINRGDK